MFITGSVNASVNIEWYSTNAQCRRDNMKMSEHVWIDDGNILILAW